MKILVFSAHPDDEVIGIGGTLRKLADTGAVIRLVIFSDGAEGYTILKEKETIVATRTEETRKVCAVLGIRESFNLHGLDWNLKVNNETYRAVIHHIRQFQPDLIFTHSRADYNDHVAVHDVVTEGWFHAGIPCALSEGPAYSMVPLYEFEVLQKIAKPDIVVDITDTYKTKVEAMTNYTSQQEIVGGIFQAMEGRALELGSLIGVKYGEALTRSSYRPRALNDVTKLTEL